MSVQDIPEKLSARQRGMLEAMGIKLWWSVPQRPATVPEPSKAAPSSSAKQETQVPVASTPVRTRVEAAPGASTVSPTTSPAASTVRMAEGGPDVWLDAPVRLYGPDAADSQGGWVVVADLPPHSDSAHAIDTATDERRLLDHMLRALGLHDGRVPVHLVSTHRGATTGASTAQPLDGAMVRIQTLAPRVILAMGPLAAQGLLGRVEPIGRLRGRPAAIAACPGAQVVATYHLDYLLRNGADKAKAWADLCMTAAGFEASGPAA